MTKRRFYLALHSPLLPPLCRSLCRYRNATEAPNRTPRNGDVHASRPW
jgi:hypothetical protein